MVRQEQGRWDVSIKSNAVCLERISDGDKQLFEDSLAPEEARELAGLLTKFADKADEAGKSEKSKDDDSDKSDKPKDEDSDKSKSKDSDKSENKSEDSDKSGDEDAEKSDDSDESSD